MLVKFIGEYPLHHISMVWDHFFELQESLRSSKFATLGLDAKIAGATTVSLDVCFFWCFFGGLYHSKSPCFTTIWGICLGSCSEHHGLSQIQVGELPRNHQIRQKPWKDAVLRYGEAEIPRDEANTLESKKRERPKYCKVVATQICLNFLMFTPIWVNDPL